MANYANAKATIAANIYTNHLGQVTAEMVKTAADAIVDTLIAGGYLYAGIAHPGDAAVTPDANVFYIATEPGTYTNFVGAGGSLVVADGEVAIFKYNGTWSKEVTGAATAAQVTELGQNLSQLVIPNINGVCPMESFGFVNGVAVTGQSEVNYSTLRRLISVPLRLNISIGILRITNNSSGTVKVMASGKVDGGTFNPLFNWTTRNATLNLFGQDTDVAYIMVAYSDESNIDTSALSQLQFSVLQSESIDNAPSFTSDNPVKSKGVIASDADVFKLIAPNISGELKINDLRFVNGNFVVQVSRAINYIGQTRLVSFPIQLNVSGGTLKITNTGTLKLYAGVQAIGELFNMYPGTSGWFTGNKELPLYGLSSYDLLYIMIAKQDDSAISPSDISGIKFEVSQDEGEHGNGILDFNPSLEMLPKLLNIKRRYVSYGGGTTGKDVLTGIFFSDIHADNTNIARIKDFFTEYSSYIDFGIQTGDLIGGSFSDGMPSGYAQITNFINVIGNHDSMNREGTPPDHQWVLVDQKSVYDVVIAPYVLGWGVVQPANADANGYCYFYKDFAANSVRVIALDCMHWDATQLSWLESTLADAKTNNYDVLICVHYPPFNVNQEKDKNPFTSYVIGSTSAGILDASAANAVKTFINNGGSFVGWLCGHIHQDVSGFGVSGSGFENQFVFSIATASVAPSVNYSEMGRSNGNKTQDCFNIIGIDTTSKLLKVIRVGADYDRFMRRRNVITIDYANSTILYADM